MFGGSARHRISTALGGMPVEAMLGAGASFNLPDAVSATVRVRHFGSAPLIADNSKRSDPTTLVNLGFYKQIERSRIGLDVLNLFDAKDADITYWYVSRPQGERAGGVGDYHAAPVPRLPAVRFLNAVHGRALGEMAVW